MATNSDPLSRPSGDSVVQFADVEGKGDREERAAVVVIGTGAGGATVAAELAEGGVEVIMLEEGGYYSAKDFSLDSPEMVRKLYRNAGTAVIRGRPNILFSEGRCVGGSTVVRGGLAERTAHDALKHRGWANGRCEVAPG